MATYSVTISRDGIHVLTAHRLYPQVGVIGATGAVGVEMVKVSRQSPALWRL